MNIRWGITGVKHINTGKPKDFPFTREELLEEFVYDNGKLLHKYTKQGDAKKGSVAGCKTAQGYIHLRVKGKVVKAHRAVWVIFNGTISKDFIIDHINQIKWDNRIENLRLADNTINNQNRTFKGYSYHKRVKKYITQIGVNSKNIHLGYFDTAEEAREAYVKAKEKYHIIKERV